MNSEEKQNIIDELPFNVGKLHVKYLGVPLVTKKLGAKECKQLVDKDFCGAKENLKKEGQKSLGKIFVSLKVKEGKALNLKPLGPWNEVLIMKNLWNIISEKNSLWVKWVNVVKLKGRNIWADCNDSWMWKNLLSLREKCRGNIYRIIRNGTSTSVSYDKWCDVYPLNTIVNARNIYNERLSDNLKVADLIVDNKWNWPSGLEVKFPILKKLEVPKIKSNKEDGIKWKDRKGNLAQYAFILWMAVKGRLQTQDRVAVWNLNNNMKCSMCNKTNDSHSHLFFECEYSNKIWKDLSGGMKVNNMANSWNAIDDFYVSSPCNNSIWSIMIIESVRTQMMGLKVRKTAVVDKVADIWDLKATLKFIRKVACLNKVECQPDDAQASDLLFARGEVVAAFGNI
ncbi:RNA-directed DNA polymerase, eukaryota, reverse transcriptase zinc-binding domain protein [Tanacetum coccineum]